MSSCRTQMTFRDWRTIITSQAHRSEYGIQRALKIKTEYKKLPEYVEDKKTQKGLSVTRKS